MDEHGKGNERRDKFSDLVPRLVIKERYVEALSSQFQVNKALLDQVLDSRSLLHCFISFFTSYFSLQSLIIEISKSICHPDEVSFAISLELGLLSSDKTLSTLWHKAGRNQIQISERWQLL